MQQTSCTVYTEGTGTDPMTVGVRVSEIPWCMLYYIAGVVPTTLQPCVVVARGLDRRWLVHGPGHPGVS